MFRYVGRHHSFSKFPVFGRRDVQYTIITLIILMDICIGHMRMHSVVIFLY